MELFEDLIEELKKVKNDDDLTQEVVELLTDTTIVALSEFNRKLHGVQDPKHLFNITRSVMLNHFDNLLLDISEVED